ncbi:hypothetical protein [Isoptericola sp. NPDC056134]|uniref:hypothetical protein n=1 Tax=Isoptericola sp. NPDC056134 TaxID=3345723 RepID=UPI0035EB5028
MEKYDDGTLVTGRSSHEVYVIQGGKRRWVPDSWTMANEGLSPADLVILEDEDLGEIAGDRPLESAVPLPNLEGCSVVETEDGVFEVKDGKLLKVLDPRALIVNFRPPEGVTFLPASLCRGLYQNQPPEV